MTVSIATNRPWEDDESNTALHCAAADGDDVAVQYLLGQCRVNEKNSRGFTPLHLAVLYGARYQGRTVSSLIKAGADVNAEDNFGQTPLHLACRSLNCCELLLAHGATLNVRTGKGVTPLHLAVSYGQREIVRLLLARGADTTIRNVLGQTPLDVAVEREDSSLIDLLRQYVPESS